MIVIGTRGSRLALWQAEHVRDELAARFPAEQFRLEIIKTTGDTLQIAPLTEIGGRGVFTKEIEVALLERRVDIAVHSLKDLPTALPAGLHVAAVPPREDVRDAIVLRQSNAVTEITAAELPPGFVIGTSSLRRAAQLKFLRSDSQIRNVRGNLDTRLKKLDAGEYDALILAVAGLNRLGLSHRINGIFTNAEMLPQIGQGALGVETRLDDHTTNEVVSALDHQPTHQAIAAERAFLHALEAGCQFPVAANAVVNENQLHLTGLVAAADGSQVIRDEIVGAATNAVELGVSLAKMLSERGALRILNASATPAI